MEKINFLSVFYADNEYTTQIGNQEMALLYASRPEYRQRPLLIETIEHAGWRMIHYFDTRYPKGLCVGTANDAAHFSAEERRVIETINSAHEKNHLPDVRRTTEEAMIDAANALRSLGLNKPLTADEAGVLYTKAANPDGVDEHGLDIRDWNVQMALSRFYIVCKRAKALERTA